MATRTALLLLGTLSAAHGIGWSISGCSSSTFTSRSISIACSGSSSCSLGDTARVSGSVYATSSFDDEEVTLQPCILSSSLYCPDYARIGAGSLCDWLSPSDGQDCGEAGTYDVYHEEKIPEEDKVPSYLQSMLSYGVTVDMVLGDGSCGGGSYQMAYGMAGAASLALLGAAALRRRRRKREGDEAEGGPGFVQMTDHAAVV